MVTRRLLHELRNGDARLLEQVERARGVPLFSQYSGNVALAHGEIALAVRIAGVSLGKALTNGKAVLKSP